MDQNRDEINSIKIQCDPHYYYKTINLSPLFLDIQNFPLPQDYKSSTFEMFSKEGDPRQHILLLFQEEFNVNFDNVKKN